MAKAIYQLKTDGQVRRLRNEKGLATPVLFADNDAN